MLAATCTAPKDTDICRYGIQIKNESNKVLYIDWAEDTILRNYMDPRIDPYQPTAKQFAGVSNNPLGRLFFSRNGSPMCVELLYKTDVEVYVFMYDSVMLGNRDWKDIRNEYLVAKRYDLTLQDLENMNWTIIYDGN